MCVWGGGGGGGRGGQVGEERREKEREIACDDIKPAVHVMTTYKLAYGT